MDPLTKKTAEVHRHAGGEITELGEVRVTGPQPSASTARASGNHDQEPKALCKNGGCKVWRSGRVDGGEPRTESPWHSLKTVFLLSVIVAFLLWIIVYTLLDQYRILWPSSLFAAFDRDSVWDSLSLYMAIAIADLGSVIYDLIGSAVIHVTCFLLRNGRTNESCDFLRNLRWRSRSITGPAVRTASFARFSISTPPYRYPLFPSHHRTLLIPNFAERYIYTYRNHICVATIVRRETRNDEMNKSMGQFERPNERELRQLETSVNQIATLYISYRFINVWLL